MRGLFNKIFFNAVSRLLKRCVFKGFQPKFSVNICKFSSYTRCLFINVMNRFNKVANIEGNRVHISDMTTTMSMATYFMATYYKSLATMYMKEFKNL